MSDKKCAWCVSADFKNVHVKDNEHVFCLEDNEVVGKDSWCNAYVRCVGSDDDKGE